MPCASLMYHVKKSPRASLTFLERLSRKVSNYQESNNTRRVAKGKQRMSCASFLIQKFTLGVSATWFSVKLIKLQCAHATLLLWSFISKNWTTGFFVLRVPRDFLPIRRGVAMASHFSSDLEFWRRTSYTTKPWLLGATALKMVTLKNMNLC